MLRCSLARFTFAISAYTFAATAFPAEAEITWRGREMDVAEFQRRLEICLSAEEWLRNACLETLRATRVDQPTGAAVNGSEAADGSLKDELHMVGIYEPMTRKTEGGPFQRGEVQINVNRPGKSVTLVMASYVPVRWIVTSTPGTEVSRIIVGGHDNQRSEVLLNGVLAQVEHGQLPLAYQSQGSQFQPFYEAAAELAGIAKADSFQGEYTAPESGFFITVAPGVPTRKEIQQQLLENATDRMSLSPGMQAALSSDASAARAKWKFGKSGFTGLNEAGKPVKYDVSLDVPEVSWPFGAAYDPKSQTLWGVTFGGEGFLYEYNIAQNQWLAWSMHNIDVGGLIFDSETGHLIATPGRFLNNGFLVMDRHAKVISVLRISQRDFPGLMDAYDLDSSRSLPLEPIFVEGTKILVRADWSMDRNPAGHPDLVYLVDLATGAVELIR